MTIKELQEEIIAEFELFDDWMEKYEYLIELGKSLPLIDSKHKQTENLIFGCQSNVWLYAEKNEDKIVFTADGDAILTKGIISLLIRIYSNQTPKTIIETNADFIDKIGLKEHLSPTRANGLVSMIKRIKYFALKFELENN